MWAKLRLLIFLNCNIIITMQKECGRLWKQYSYSLQKYYVSRNNVLLDLLNTSYTRYCNILSIMNSTFWYYKR